MYGNRAGNRKRSGCRAARGREDSGRTAARNNNGHCHVHTFQTDYIKAELVTYSQILLRHMVKMFVHHNPVELHFGPKSFEKIGTLAGRYGKKALLVTGKQSMRKSGILDELERILGEAGIDSVI
ncbi:MAG TPA: iron-containing alcohol dehydrogenase, partial [Thermoplasmatales archaeon]|nr:iron-containing alcohol dehydrogenase [Thermoplasmatales archaeon]